MSCLLNLHIDLRIQNPIKSLHSRPDAYDESAIKRNCNLPLFFCLSNNSTKLILVELLSRISWVTVGNIVFVVGDVIEVGGVVIIFRNGVHADYKYSHKLYKAMEQISF